MMRLAKYLALAGVASRRQAEEYIKAGKVTVNGKIHRDVAQQIDEHNDVISYAGRKLEGEKKVYYALYKPVGYLSASRDQHSDKVVTHLVPLRPTVYPVGRLDKDSEGLIILTNDGDLAYQLSHPKFVVTKEYEVELNRPFDEADGIKLLNGIKLTEGVAKVDAVRKVGARRIVIKLHQGWNRQVRRMLGSLNYEAMTLKRVAHGPIRLERLKVGTHRLLKASDFKV